MKKAQEMGAAHTRRVAAENGCLISSIERRRKPGAEAVEDLAASAD
jgi:hypothetical protein